MIIFKKALQTLVLSLAVFTLPFDSVAFAEEIWAVYRDPDNLYEARIPHEYTKQEYSINLGTGYQAKSDVITAEISDANNPDNKRTYSINYTQTLGTNLTGQDKDVLMEKLVNLHLDSYAAYNGQLLNRKNFQATGNIKIADLYIKYTPEPDKDMYTRIRIYISSTAKAVQTITGPQSAMFSFRSKDYFNSLNLRPGFKETATSMFDTWKSYTSDLNIFTAKLPEVDGLYYYQEPEKFSADNYEAIVTNFYDPMLRQNLAYRIYGYKLAGTDVNESIATALLTKRHIQNNNAIVTAADFTYEGNGNIQVIFPIPPTQQNKNATYARIYARYSGEYLVIQEAWANETVITSEFLNNVISNISFHPDGVELNSTDNTEPPASEAAAAAE